MKITSEAFAHNGEIPPQYTCDGEDSSPPLAFADVPAAARSLVLVVDDPDAPDPAAPKMTWVHWLLYELPPETGRLAAGIGEAALPPGTLQGRNSWGRSGYGGPCPPIGRHRYFHKLYALDTALGGLVTPDKDALAAAMAGHVIAQAELVGTYQR